MATPLLDWLIGSSMWVNEFKECELVIEQISSWGTSQPSPSQSIASMESTWSWEQLLVKVMCSDECRFVCRHGREKENWALKSHSVLCWLVDHFQGNPIATLIFGLGNQSIDVNGWVCVSKKNGISVLTYTSPGRVKCFKVILYSPGFKISYWSNWCFWWHGHQLNRPWKS